MFVCIGHYKAECRWILNAIKLRARGWELEYPIKGLVRQRRKLQSFAHYTINDEVTVWLGVILDDRSVCTLSSVSYLANHQITYGLGWFSSKIGDAFGAIRTYIKNRHKHTHIHTFRRLLLSRSALAFVYVTQNTWIGELKRIKNVYAMTLALGARPSESIWVHARGVPIPPTRINAIESNDG